MGENIASMHGGHVPLYGRLFRQWMHHVYPVECVFPAPSMSKKPRSADQFEMETGRDPLLSDADLERYRHAELSRTASGTEGSDRSDAASELPWSDDEELFITCLADGNPSASGSVWRVVFLAAIITSMAFMFAQKLGSASAYALPV